MLSEDQARAVVLDSIAKVGGNTDLAEARTLAEAGITAGVLPALARAIASDPAVGLARLGADLAKDIFGSLTTTLTINALIQAVVTTRVVCSGRDHHVQEPPYPEECGECGSSVP